MIPSFDLNPPRLNIVNCFFPNLQRIFFSKNSYTTSHHIHNYHALMHAYRSTLLCFLKIVVFDRVQMLSKCKMHVCTFVKIKITLTVTCIATFFK